MTCKSNLIYWTFYESLMENCLRFESWNIILYSGDECSKFPRRNMLLSDWYRHFMHMLWCKRQFQAKKSRRRAFIHFKETRLFYNLVWNTYVPFCAIFRSFKNDYVNAHRQSYFLVSLARVLFESEIFEAFVPNFFSSLALKVYSWSSLTWVQF